MPITSADIDARIEGDTLASRFLTSLDNHPDVTVLRWKDSDGEWQGWTLGEVADKVARLVTGLRALGLEPGDRVVMMMRNRPDFHPIDIAVLFCGATPVSIYNSSAPDQIEYLVNDCGAKLAILEDTGFYERFNKVRESIPTIENIVVVDDDDLLGDDVVRLDSLLASEPADLFEAASSVTPDTMATIIYTSGTTGPPKGVVLTHYNATWTLASIAETMYTQTDITDLVGHRHVSYLPLAHVFERLLGHWYMMNFATQVICCPDTTQVAAYAAETKPHILIGVPRVWEKMHAGVMGALAADPDRKKQFDEAVAAAMPISERITWGTATDEDIETFNFLDAVAFTPVKQLLGLDEAEICISGAAPIPPEILSWFRAIGVPLSEGYGMSETTSILSWSQKAKPGYVGGASTGVELKIADDGEILARGGNMFGGYLGLPEKTAETLDDDGWVHTGDIGEIDEDGYLKIVDRKKELIITAGGKNISPANLEAALKMIPLVGQACAIGDQRPFVSALVVLDPDVAAAWAATHGLDGDDATLAALAENPEVLSEIEAGREEVMKEFNNAEAVKKVTVLGEEWLPDSDLLTPTSKLKRRGIHAKFDDEIQELYVK
jgi:long-chain acyl-CoA synthetase